MTRKKKTTTPLTILFLQMEDLPNEIIFMIFDYLSSNDILYTFFFLTQRFNNSLLQNQRYSNYLQIPTTNLDTWEIILSIIGPRIKCLNITTIQLNFPLTYFPNLKSLIISSMYGLPEEKLKYIINNSLFQNLSSFEIKQEKIFSNPYLPDNSICQDEILKKVFNENNSLEIFEYSLRITPSIIYIDVENNFRMNFKLRSLTLALVSFRNIFTIIRYTPNLKYLKVKAQIPFSSELPAEKTNVKLEQLDLILNKHNDFVRTDLVIDGIKQFSSSLIRLSLDLVDYSVRGINQFSFDSLQFPQLLKSMKQLQQFHFYMSFPSCQYHPDIDLSQFPNLSFGMHSDYLYTLPFHFNNIYDCFEDFNHVNFKNYEILKKHSRIWHHVKSIQLHQQSVYNRDFVKELKIKMPKLTLIKFTGYNSLPHIHKQNSSCNENDVTLKNVTTIEFMRESVENQKDWIIYSLPNLKHLILSHSKMPSKDSCLMPILNRQIQRLDIDAHSGIELVAEAANQGYFSSVENINFHINNSDKSPEWYADIIMKIFKNVKHLQIMMIRFTDFCHGENELSFPEKNLAKIGEYFTTNQMHRTYQIIYMKEYTLFVKTSSN